MNMRKTIISAAALLAFAAPARAQPCSRDSLKAAIDTYFSAVASAWVNFNQSLPDVHIFKIRSGQVEWIQAVFGGRTQDAIRPDERK
jgi:hypothetical protein